jgi:hypothetical protein
MNRRDYERLAELRQDQAVVSAAADRVRGSRLPLPDPERYREPLGELLDLVADNLGELDHAVRGHAVRVCRKAFGDTMDSPGTRRTRRR